MGPMGFVIAILGCADGGAGCQTVATLSTRYENAAQCSSARGAALDANSDLDFPTLIAECRRSAHPAAAKASATTPPLGKSA
jgi:acyl-CoA synthetase (AMP-forming)/AMP-acid ligase II